MNANVYTSGQLVTIRQEVNQVRDYANRIKNSVDTFDYAINDATISQWVNDTEVGAEIKQKVVTNNENLIKLADALLGVYQATSTLCTQAEQTNTTAE